ncbi:MAG: PilZ domain-containing protein [SAR324 cluster bacterium]|nr:PilZ domain-containing protein [SAR324 cluster bacterium]
METSASGAAEVLKVLKFSYFKQVSLAEEIVFYGIIFILIAIGIRQLNKHLKKENDKKTAYLKQDFEEKEKLTFQTLIANLKLLPEEYRLLETISGSSAFRKNYSIIESVRKFEFKVEKFKQSQDSTRILTHIYNLRHKLGFHYKNVKVPFICTQMLALKAKLECSILVGSKTILFISPVVNISEKYLYIKPPTKHKKPVNLKPFAQLSCKIRRDDGVYEFNLPIIRQVAGKENHLVLGHTRDIKKIIEREFERIPICLISTMFQLTNRQVNLPKNELQLLKEDELLPELDGEITDLSLGGLYFTARGEQQKLWEKNFVMFRIPGVMTRNDLQAQVVSIASRQGKFHVNLKFFHLSDVERLKLNKFLLRLSSKMNSQQAEQSSLDSASTLLEV